MRYELWSTDAAPEEPHQCLTRQDAAMREGRRCPRVRPHHATWFFFFLANLHWIGPTQAVSAKTTETADLGQNSKNKILKILKKRCKMHRLNLILNPTLAHFTQTHQTSALCLSLSHSVTRLSLSLCSLPLSLLVVRHSTSAESITWLTSIHSFFNSLSCILNLGIEIKLSILVWSLICDLWFLIYES